MDQIFHGVCQDLVFFFFSYFFDLYNDSCLRSMGSLSKRDHTFLKDCWLYIFFGISYIITPNIFFSFILLKWWYTLKKDNDPLLVDKYEDLRTSIYRLWEQPCCSINMAANLFARNQWYVSWVLYPNLRLSLNIQCRPKIASTLQAVMIKSSWGGSPLTYVWYLQNGHVISVIDQSRLDLVFCQIFVSFVFSGNAL